MDKLPPDLEDVAQRLTQARTQSTPLELEDLRGRVQRRAARRPRSVGRLGMLLRVNGMATLLTSGLILTTGASAVLAAKAVTGGSKGGGTISAPKDAAACEYTESHSDTYTGTQGKGNSNATISVTYFCGQRTLCMDSSKGISNYKFNNAAKVEVADTDEEICLPVPPGATSITIKSGTTTYTFQIPAEP